MPNTTTIKELIKILETHDQNITVEYIIAADTDGELITIHLKKIIKPIMLMLKTFNFNN